MSNAPAVRRNEEYLARTSCCWPIPVTPGATRRIGSRTSIYNGPQLVVLSVAAGDPDGLPSQDVLDSLEGYSLLRTDRSGWISVSTDGNEMRVEVERGE